MATDEPTTSGVAQSSVFSGDDSNDAEPMDICETIERSTPVTAATASMMISSKVRTSQNLLGLVPLYTSTSYVAYIVRKRE